MAWAVYAAARGLSPEQIEHEILNGRDLSRKVRPRQFDYAARAARKAIARKEGSASREFEMKNNGGKRQRVEIVASRVQFLGRACGKDRRDRYR
jgi:hypothetical protein